MGPPPSLTAMEAGEKKESLMYTPMVVNRVKISKCLIEAGAEVNLIPTSELAKHGFGYSPDCIEGKSA